MRFQLALNVDDLDQAVAYYSKLLGAPVHKRKPGYANFAVDEPPIKLVLFENPGASERLNHVGFESSDDAEVERAAQRLNAAGIATEVIRDEHCCHARKSTVWAQDPQGLMWEFYKVQRDEASFGPDAPEPDSRPAPPADAAGGVCCGG
jgi:catechol 2,3-dioxygenase-like lactoylglutathione lyase family enzyme